MVLPFFRRAVSISKRHLPGSDLSLPHQSDRGLAGPPAVAVARQAFAGRQDILIDPLETEFTVSDVGVLVRAWVLVPDADLPEHLLRSITDTSTKLAGLPAQTRQIFFLATAYRLSTDRISETLKLGRASVRRQLLRAIARLDGRAL